MMWLYILALFVAAVIGGCLPIFIKIGDHQQRNLLAFSGSLLIGICFLHLLPEAFKDLEGRAGIYILAGFFLQLILQKYSHGIEHGHNTSSHNHGISDSHSQHHTHTAFSVIFFGLALHAFMEGIPVGYHFHSGQTKPALVLGVAAHKVPEALSLMPFVAVQSFSKAKKWAILIAFASITPITALLANYYQQQYLFTSKIISVLLPVVLGAYTHIATIIFFESETRPHQLTRSKVIAVILGLLLALSTLLIDA